jgi:hypothetical protein
MGGLLGVAFGVFTASLDTQVRLVLTRMSPGHQACMHAAPAPKLPAAHACAESACCCCWCLPCTRIHTRTHTQGIDAAPAGETKPTRVVLKETWVLMKDKSRSYAKGFAGMGFLYSGTECLIEKYRAKHDKYNATLAGCATGGLMAAPGARACVCVCVCVWLPLDRRQRTPQACHP